jgi:uncharacterized membrane protein SpoIIM required for sporulation
MHIDRFIAVHQAEWDELDDLARRRSQLDGAGVARLVSAYQQVSAHLSVVRTDHRDRALEQRLTRTLAAASAAIYRPSHHRKGAGRRFFSETFPAAVWWHRRHIGIAAGLFLAPAILVGAWLTVSDRALDASAPEAVRAAYLETDFEAYYSSEPAAQFATEVFFNNIQVAMLAFAVGILLCVPTCLVLIYNGASIGVAAGMFTAAGRWQLFWGLVTPHGLLEIAAIIVAGASGLALGWSIIAPGDRARAASVADAGKRSVVVILGLILAFAVAGLIEGFVTGSGLPTFARLLIGVSAFGAFSMWVVVFGRRAASLGHTGTLAEDLPSAGV